YALCCADLVEAGYLRRLGVMPSRIIGMNHDQPTCLWRDGLLQCMKVDMPAMIVKQWIAYELHVIYICQKIKKRIAWRGNQNFIARIAEQPEDMGVSFAGADRQKKIVSADLISSRSIVLAHGFAR